MLTEQEIMNHAFKDLLFHEELMTKKYADLVKDEKDPQLLKLFLNMQAAADKRYHTLSQKMSKFGIV